MDFTQGQIEQQSAGIPFGDILQQAIRSTEAAEKAGQQGNYDLAIGNVEDLAQIQIDSLKMQTMVQTTVQLTSRAVSAYKEIMQMQL